MTIVDTQAEPLPGRCPSAMRFDGMLTQFECIGNSGHRYPWHWFEDDGVKVYWLSGGEETARG